VARFSKVLVYEASRAFCFRLKAFPILVFRSMDEASFSIIFAMRLYGILVSLLIFRSFRHFLQSLHDWHINCSHGSQLRAKSTDDMGLSMVNLLIFG